MENIETLQITDEFTGQVNEYVIIDKGEGHFVSMRKHYWDELEAAKEAQSLQIVLNNRKGVVTNGDHQQNPLQRRGDN